MTAHAPPLLAYASMALVGVVWLGEPFGSAHVAAFGLALAGLLLAVWPAARRF